MCKQTNDAKTIIQFKKTINRADIDLEPILYEIGVILANAIDNKNEVILESISEIIRALDCDKDQIKFGFITECANNYTDEEADNLYNFAMSNI